MTVIALMMCLLADHFIPQLSKIRCMRWVSAYCTFVDKYTKQRWHVVQWLAIVALFVPLLLGTVLLQCLLSHIFYGLFGLLFNIVILYYCLGTIHFHRYMVDQEGNEISQPVETVLQQGQQQVFIMMLWFVVFGAVGALFYRSLLEMRRYYTESAQPETQARLSTIQQYVDWLPLRINAFIFALIGDFSNTFHYWRHHVCSGVSQNESLVQQCGLKALAIPEGSTEETVATYQEDAVSLMERALLMMLALLIIIVLTAWIQ